MTVSQLIFLNILTVGHKKSIIQNDHWSYNIKNKLRKDD